MQPQSKAAIACWRRQCQPETGEPPAASAETPPEPPGKAMRGKPYPTQPTAARVRPAPRRGRVRHSCRRRLCRDEFVCKEGPPLKPPERKTAQRKVWLSGFPQGSPCPENT